MTQREISSQNLINDLITYVFYLFQIVGTVMIRLNQWPPLIENCAYCHTKAIHVAVEAPLFLLLYFRCYIYEIIYIIDKLRRIERKKLMNLKLKLIFIFLPM